MPKYKKLMHFKTHKDFRNFFNRKNKTSQKFSVTHPVQIFSGPANNCRLLRPDKPVYHV